MAGNSKLNVQSLAPWAWWRACVASKVRGRHIYPPRGDHQARQQWLARQGLRHGFEVVAVHCTSGTARVADQAGRDFALDATDFSGVLKVTDTAAFHAACAALQCNP